MSILVLLLLVYLSIGLGLMIMVVLLHEEEYMNEVLGPAAPMLLGIAWPWIIKKIYDSNH